MPGAYVDREILQNDPKYKYFEGRLDVLNDWVNQKLYRHSDPNFTEKDASGNIVLAECIGNKPWTVPCLSIWMAYNHYKNRKGIPMPNTDAFFSANPSKAVDLFGFHYGGTYLTHYMTDS
jgi:hypothetical protein